MTARRLLVGIAAVAFFVAYFIRVHDPHNTNRVRLLGPTVAEIQPRPAGAYEVLETELPDDGLLVGLADICATDARNSVDSDSSTGVILEQIDSLDEWKQDVSQRLSVSSSSEHLLLAAFLEAESASRAELLNRAISNSPADSFLLWSAVQICSESGDSEDCPMEEWEQRLIDVDGSNSESWIRIAANRFAAGEPDAALEAMKYASTSAESRAYWTETIEMIERGLTTGSDYAFPERAEFALGMAASRLPNYGDYVTMCRKQSSESVEWAYTCLRYGKLVEGQGKTEIGIAIAQVLQKLALEALGEVERANEVEQRIQARRQEQLDSIKDYNPAADYLIVSNPSLFYSYLAAVRSEGEALARQRVAAEIERLVRQQPELICK